MNVLRTLLRVLTSDVVMEPLVVLSIAYGIRVYQNGRRNEAVEQSVIDLVDYIEEHYKAWGIKGGQKLDRFLELFIEEFKKQMGRMPNDQELRSTIIKAEAYVQRARRESGISYRRVR
jgi:hypothetical protein